MAISLKQAGAWKEPTNVSVKDAGVWKTADKMYVKANGVWQEQWSAEPPYAPPVIVQFTNSTGTLTISGGVQAGDILIAAGSSGSGTAYTPASGWWANLQTRTSTQGGNNIALTGYRILDGSEGGTSIGCTSGTRANALLIIRPYIPYVAAEVDVRNGLNRTVTLTGTVADDAPVIMMGASAASMGTASAPVITADGNIGNRDDQRKQRNSSDSIFAVVGYGLSDTTPRALTATHGGNFDDQANAQTIISMNLTGN